MSLHWRCPDCGEALTPSCSCGSAPVCEAHVWRVGVPAAPTGFPQERADHLADIEHSHFWFAPRARLLTDLIQRLRRPEDQHILELGCGSGQMLHRYTELGLTSTGVDGTRSSIERAALEAPEATVIHANVEALPLSSEQFDFVAAFDVLEHVEPLPFLNEARRVARTGARLLISVPASQWLWGPLDEAAGHRCRYDRPQLEAELRQSGWKPLGHTRYQFLLFPVILASRLMRASKAERHPPKRLGTLLGAVNAAEVRLLSGRRLPWGSSLMMWAEAA